MAKRDFYFLVERDGNGGFVADAAQFMSCEGRGESLDELMANMRKAIESRLQFCSQDSHSEICGMYKIQAPAEGQMNSRHFYVLVKDDGEGGYIGIAPELKGCLSHGMTLEELLSNMDEVIQLCLEDGEEAENSRFFGIQKVTV